MRERIVLVALAASLAALTGCASLMPVTSAPPASAPAAADATPVPVPTPTASAPAPAPAKPAPAKPAAATLDSTTVSEAGRAVLATIPEPLPATERVPAPATTPAAPKPEGVSMPAPEAAYDTLRASVPPLGAPVTDGDVPVPSPTQPLGDKPGTLARLLAPDTSAAAVATPASSAPPASAPAAPAASAPKPSAPPPASAPSTSGDCWRVQVGAPAEQARAEGLRKAAESQLMLPFVVEHEKGLYKVRTKSCVSGEAADALKKRATLAGFTGVFRFVAGGSR